jgi:hypothetical protein
MNIYRAALTGLLPAMIISALRLFKPKGRRRAALFCLAVLCAAVPALVPKSAAGAGEESADMLLSRCRAYLMGETAINDSPRNMYSRLAAAVDDPEARAYLENEGLNPAAADLCRRLRDKAGACSDRASAYMTLAELEYLLGREGRAEEAIGGAFSYVPDASDIAVHALSSDFAAFAEKERALFGRLAELPSGGSNFSLPYALIYAGESAVTLPRDPADRLLLLDGPRSYIIPSGPSGFVLPADIEGGAYTPMLSDGENSDIGSPLYVTRGMTITEAGGLSFSACAARSIDGATEMSGMVSLGGRLRFNGNVTVRNDGLVFDSAYVVFAAGPLAGGALTVSPDGPAALREGEALFTGTATAGGLRLEGVEIVVGADYMRLRRAGATSVLSRAVSALLSDGYITASIGGDMGGGALFSPHTDRLPPEVEVTAAYDGGYMLLTVITGEDCIVSADGVSSRGGSFVYRAPRVPVIELTVEDESGNRTLVTVTAERELPPRGAFRLYDHAGFVIIAAAIALNTSAAALFVTGKTRLFIGRRASFASVLAVSAGALYFAMSALSGYIKTVSPAFASAALSSPAFAYDIILARDRSAAFGLVLTAAALFMWIRVRRQSH